MGWWSCTLSVKYYRRENGNYDGGGGLEASKVMFRLESSLT